MITARKVHREKLTGYALTKIVAVLVGMVLFMGSAACAAPLPATETPPPADGAAAATASGETIVEDFENGHWLYENADTGIRIEITRKADTENQIIWYEADLRSTEKSPIRFLTANAENPGKGFAYPETIMCANQAVFGVNDDQFGFRIYNHQKVGIIIRNAKLINNKTRKSGNLSWPTLDTAAFFNDGSMLTFSSQEHTGEEYLEMGADTVLSFGPWLVQRGQINTLCKKYFTTREPRTAIGMIEPYHYIVLSVEGRVKQSRGVGMQWLAEKMMELHAQEAINLDGGKTTSIVFMGKCLKSNNPSGKSLKRRSVTGMITLGTSAQVPAEAEQED